MNNDVLNIDIQKIRVVQAVVEFNEYESLKQQALELASNIEQVEVTEENVQMSKKMVAAVNKKVKEMEDKRIAIKKEILSPYEQFEQQVKEIVTIVKNADSIVREQIRELEEIERDEKQNLIQEIFAKRIKHYFFSETFKFDDFLKPQHLNKSVSLKSVESEMVQWLEKIESDILAINSFPNREAVLTEYYDTKDLAISIKIVNEREERKQQVSKLVKPTKKATKTTYNITLLDDKDLLAVEMFMQLKNIEYELEKVEI